MDVPWLAAHQKSDSKKPDKLESEENVMGSFSSPELKARASISSITLQPENEKPFTRSAKGKCEDANKSKVKVTKLMKTMKPENPKKIVKQNSKDSVVLVGYKCLKTAAPEDISKCFEGAPSCNQKEELDSLVSGHSCGIKNFTQQYNQKEVQSIPSRTEQRTANLDKGEDSQCSSVLSHYADSIIFGQSDIPQAGIGGTHGDSSMTHRTAVEDSYGLPGVTKIEVKPYCKNICGGDRVCVRIGTRTDVSQSGAQGENLQNRTFESSETEKKVKSEEAALLEKDVFSDFRHTEDALAMVKTNQPNLSTKETPIGVVSGDILKLPDATYASSRFSDSGVESEPSSFAMYPSADLALETPQGQSACNNERTFPQALVKPEFTLRNLVESRCTESVSEIQSSLTSINSLPSDDDLSPDDSSKMSVVPECQLSDSKTILDLGAIDLTKYDIEEPNALPHPCVVSSGQSDNENTPLPSSPSNVKDSLQWVSNENTSAVKISSPPSNYDAICKDFQRPERDLHNIEKANEMPSEVVHLGKSCIGSDSLCNYTEDDAKASNEGNLCQPLEEQQIDELKTGKKDDFTSTSVLSVEGSTDMLKQGLVENYFGSQSSTDAHSADSSNPVSPQRSSVCSLLPDEEDEQDQDMVENGYFEEADDINLYEVSHDSEDTLGLTSGRALRTERMNSELFRDTTNMVPLYSPGSLTFPSALKGYPCNALWSSKDKSSATRKQSGSLSWSTISSVPWYECSPKPQILA